MTSLQNIPTSSRKFKNNKKTRKKLYRRRNENLDVMHFEVGVNEAKSLKRRNPHQATCSTLCSTQRLGEGQKSIRVGKLSKSKKRIYFNKPLNTSLREFFLVNECEESSFLNQSDMKY